ncbi:hypothetical protein C0993_009849 [Termitomyces sp. T159_Od127]|nr:hypothetical protein C0993_009849 [Termitomyces sp. T159_Od127]
MKQRGIHDVYHASLLRIHHPNDDIRFPGRLYSQILSETEAEHEQEWAADKIVSHAYSGNDAIFEVLWRSGDKTWLPYDQVRELDLISPYLETQNVDHIAELPLGQGRPPLDDPQIFLGSLFWPGIDKEVRYEHKSTAPPSCGYLESSPNPHSLTTSYSLPTSLPTNMSFRPKDHYKPHPYLAIRPDGFLQLTSVEPNLIVHPAQLLKYLDHDEAVRNHQISSESFAPVGYEEWAAAYNASKGDNPTEFATFDIVTGLYNCDSFSIPRGILTIPYFDNRYLELRTFGIIDDKGDVIDGGWANVKNALLRPHRDAVRNQARSDARKVERALKKLRIADNPFKGYPSLSQHRSRTFPQGAKSQTATPIQTPVISGTATGSIPSDLELMPLDPLVA